jgi:hypothetical protein
VTETYRVLIKVPTVGSLQFDGLRDRQLFRGRWTRLIDRTLWGMAHRSRATRPGRRDFWAADSLEAIRPHLGPVQEELFNEK